MNKLKNKVFLVLTMILTIFLLSILIIFNYQDYTREKNSIETNLNRMQSFGIHEPNNLDSFSRSPDNEPKKIFMDSVVYTIEFDESSNLLNIISHTENDTIDSKIESAALDIISTKTKSEKIGNLYFSDYSYSFKSSNTLVLIDNTLTKQRLQKSLITSLLIFIFLEIVILYVSKILTNWIIKPAIAALDKQKQFITDASHELKTPVAVILANSEALEQDFDKKWLTNIKSETERMNRLITNLLNLATLENSSGKENFRINDLSKIIKMSVLTFEGLCFEKKIKLKTNIKTVMYNYFR